MKQRIHIFARLLAILTMLVLGCDRTSAPLKSPPGPSSAAEAPAGPAPSATAAAPQAKPFPETMAQVEQLRAAGVSWTNEEVRIHYNHIVSKIGPSDEQWKKDSLSAEERARRASEIRHNARILTRAMMSDAREVEDLRKRDQEKYGNPDGPTFEQLVAKNRDKGMTGDAVYEEIIGSSQRTNDAVNEKFGIGTGVKK